MVREELRKDTSNFMRQAGEFLASAEDNIAKGRYNAAGFDAIQSIVNSNDALTIYYLGVRGSRDHKEAYRLHVDVVRILNDASCRDILKQSLDMRPVAGYLGKDLSEADANMLVRNALKYIVWVKSKLK